MRAVLAFIISICFQICCGRYFNRRVFEYKPGIPMRDFALLDDVCEDDPNYADACPRQASIRNYCEDQKEFMMQNCPKSCGFCKEESVKPPAPAVVCEDDPNYADACPRQASIRNYCEDQKEFMMQNCPKSCGFCKEESVKPPAPAVVCEDDPNYADACPRHASIKNYCQDQKEFMMQNCPKSCGFCEEATSQPAVSTESVKPPGPAVATVTPAVSTETAKPPAPTATVTPAVSTETAKPPAPTDNQKTNLHCLISYREGLVCEDDPNYADACPEKAAIKNYCRDQEKFMRKNCPVSCGFCSNATVQPAAISTESVKSPAPAAECKDDPEYEESCKDIAATTGLCEEQEKFTQEHCALSCKWCESPITKAPIQGICEEDLPKWAARCPVWAKMGVCDEPKKQPFLHHYCRKSCKLPCKTEPPTIPGTKAPSPPAFCRDRGRNCHKWKSLGLCGNAVMPIYCGVTCDICKQPTPDECFDRRDDCEDLKKAGFCTSTVPTMEYEVKTNCLETCEFCVPDLP